MNSVELNFIWQQASKKPLLEISDIENFRSEMNSCFQQHSSLLAAFELGCQSATPGMAFLSGYQSAIRCLDASCPSDEFASFCVSEKGVKKPWDMETTLVNDQETLFLNGRKGFVMLLPDLIDRLYVLAKYQPEHTDLGLACVLVTPKDKGMSVGEPLNAPFVRDIPHAGVIFENVVVSKGQMLTHNGHEEANKPFRYWEDVHVSIAMFAWMLRHLDDQSNNDHVLRAIQEKICQLIEKFTEQSTYYNLESLALLDECQDLLESQSKSLAELAAAQWKNDRLLLQIGQRIRAQISKKLAE